MLRMTALTATFLAFAIVLQANAQISHHEMPLVLERQARIETSGAFSPAERNLIRAHLSSQQAPPSRQDLESLPPGLRKKVSRGKALPPGWQKKVVPGQTLDYQAYRQAERLPDDLLRRLPPPPAGAEILHIENKVVMLSTVTHVILDTFDLTPTR